MLVALGSGLPWRLRRAHGPEEFHGLRPCPFVTVRSAKLTQQQKPFQREGHGEFSYDGNASAFNTFPSHVNSVIRSKNHQ